MTDLRTAAEQLLTALDEWREKGGPIWQCDPSITALRAALAQQAEPCPNCASLEAQNTELDAILARLADTEPDAIFQPLTEEQIKACEKQAMVDGALPHEQRVLFARAIEKAHGIE